ncbi:Rcat domain-containing protein [Spongorhabdus nitratireducens]
MGFGCKVILHPRHVALVSIHLGKLARYFEARILSFKTRAYFVCDTSGCIYAGRSPVIEGDSYYTTQCSECGQVQVFYRGLEDHHSRLISKKNRTNLENRDLIRKKVRAGKWKVCPACGNVIERNEGCKYMRCKICRYKFCWHCLETYEQEFGDTRHNGCNEHNDIGLRGHIELPAPDFEYQRPRRRCCPCTLL